MTVSILALYYQLGGERMDPLRMFEAAGAFIGIIGAGLIVFSKGEVKNLTTAAHLWLTAVIGIACGAGAVAAGGDLHADLAADADRGRAWSSGWCSRPQDDTE